MTLAPALLVLVRAAVAEVQAAAGLHSLAARTRAGEMDQLPAMQGAISAVERVLSEGGEAEGVAS